MDSYSFKITGGKPLKGHVNVSGSKNAVLGILAAAMMIDGTCTLENVPDISDVHVMVKICESLGAKIDTSLSPDGSVTLQIDPRGINTYEATSPGVSKIRASYYLLGALLGRCGKASLRMPGGCDFGQRPIGLHLKALRQMGARGAADRHLNGGIS